MASSAQMHDSDTPSAMIKEDSPPEDDKSNGAAGSNPSTDKPQKPHRPLNRVPRACNACRKQKMKCTDADNPPCKRCRHAGIECIFEKPIRDTLNNSEQGMWRIRNLETQINSIQSTLAELVHAVRAGVPQASAPSPASHHASPGNYGAPSPSVSSHSGGVTSAYVNGTSESSSHAQPSQGYAGHGVPNATQTRQYRSHSSSSGRTIGYQSSPASHPPHLSPPQSDTTPQQGPPDHLYRSNSDTMSQYSDHRQSGSYVPQGPVVQPPYGPHLPTQHPNNPASMPPPTSLPPFSAIDVHPSGRIAPPAPPTLHIQPGPRPSFSASPISPRKPMMVSPTSAYNGPYAPSNHSYSPQSALNPTHSHYTPMSHFSDGPAAHITAKPETGDPLSSSNVTSADSSDDEGPPSELPANGLVAPFVAIRGLADAAERAAEENGGESDPPTRSGSPSRTGHYDAMDPHSHGTQPAAGIDGASGSRHDMRNGKRLSGKLGEVGDRPAKRRRTGRENARDDAADKPSRAVPDVVTKGIISEEEGRELFQIFFTGCSMFLPVFDAVTDTYEALHKRSPFCVDAICMVAAKVRDGGGPPSETYTKCLKEVHDITCQTLFAPVARQEVVQAMILVAGWGAGPKDSGWLTCGHATRMALELGMHKAWPKLLKRMHAGKIGTSQEERELVISARTWFCLYLFEHQMSFGTGRPAVLREDESVHECRLLLTHPLAIPDDMRLVSMVELMIIRERTQNMINPSDNAPIDEDTFRNLGQSRQNFEGWLHIWSGNFSKRYEAAAFHRQSLEAQVAFAELYHNAIVLRTIKGPDDVAKMRPEARELAIRSMKVAQVALHICLRSPSYREGLKYAVQYTHLSATFTASFLMRLARLFPEDCDITTIMTDVNELAEILSEIPATRFARTLKIMLRKRRRIMANRASSDASGSQRNNTSPPTAMPSTMPVMAPATVPGAPVAVAPYGAPQSLTNEQLDAFVRDMEAVPGQDLPVWLSESNLGDFALSQQGLEAFLIPPSLDEQRVVPEIW